MHAEEWLKFDSEMIYFTWISDERPETEKMKVHKLGSIIINDKNRKNTPLRKTKKKRIWYCALKNLAKNNDYFPNNQYKAATSLFYEEYTPERVKKRYVDVLTECLKELPNMWEKSNILEGAWRILNTLVNNKSPTSLRRKDNILRKLRNKYYTNEIAVGLICLSAGFHNETIKLAAKHIGNSDLDTPDSERTIKITRQIRNISGGDLIRTVCNPMSIKNLRVSFD